VTFRYRLIFYSPLSNSQAGEPPLSAVRYSQLPFISVGRLLHPQPEVAPRHGDEDPHNNFTICMESSSKSKLNYVSLHDEYSSLSLEVSGEFTLYYVP
jgi:hypothetical protein